MSCDEKGLEKIIYEYADTLFRCAYTYCGNRDDAEDIVQEVFIKYLKKQPKFKDKTHEKAWLLRVTVNLCKDFLKSFWRSNRSELSEDIPDTTNFEEKEIWENVSKLSPKYRVVIELYYCEGYSIAEIAEIIGARKSTVGNRLARAKVLLKKSYGEV